MLKKITSGDFAVTIGTCLRKKSNTVLLDSARPTQSKRGKVKMCILMQGAGHVNHPGPHLQKNPKLPQRRNVLAHPDLSEIRNCRHAATDAPRPSSCFVVADVASFSGKGGTRGNTCRVNRLLEGSTSPRDVVMHTHATDGIALHRPAPSDHLQRTVHCRHRDKQ